MARYRAGGTPALRAISAARAGWCRAALGGGVDDLSSLKIPAILPKRPFFFLGFLVYLDPGYPGYWLPAPGVRLFGRRQKNREKNPATPFCWSQVSRGSVPATKAAT